MANKSIPFQGKPTGFKCGIAPLYVGDLLSVQYGYDGFMRVVEREDGFWLEDWHKDESRDAHKDEKLNRNIGRPYQKVDPADPFAEPPIPILCEQCLETAIGYVDVEGGPVTWTDDCGVHHEETVIRREKIPFSNEIEEYPETTYTGKCKECLADPGRTSHTRELQDYFKQRYKESGLTIRTFDRPLFYSKEDIDCFIEDLKAMQGFMEEHIRRNSD